MTKQTKLFLPSRSLQNSVSFVVMHVLMAETHLGPRQETFEELWNAEDLMKLSFSIFHVTDSSHATSNCVFTFLKYIQQMERTLD